MQDRRRHVVHLVYRFAAGGLENVIVQLVNGLPRESFRHTIIALTSADPAFAGRLEPDDVEVIALAKPPGQPFQLYPRMFSVFRRLRPDVLHSCNIAALEFQPVGWAAGIPLRVHAEHGWDVADPDGTNKRFQLIRKAVRPFVDRFVAVSPQLHDYLIRMIGIDGNRVMLLPNGVDLERFRARRDDDAVPEGFPFRAGTDIVIGTVGRMEPIKNQTLLVKAFVKLAKSGSPIAQRLKLALIGDGPLKGSLRDQLALAGLADRIWLPGSRSDIESILRCLSCFVLPSHAEGTSCTLLEALASEVPVVATNVGGNGDVLAHGRLGILTPSDDVDALAAAIERTVSSPGLVGAGRQAMEKHYDLAGIMKQYEALFGSH